MDIHRCRFVPYPPAGINALAFSHASNPDKIERSPKHLRLAIGRSNGDIELWHPNDGLWFQESILRGARDRSIENLAWVQNWDDPDAGEEGENVGRLRLFSIGNSTTITEWDLGLGAPVRHANGNFGDLWCLAAQPRWPRSPANAASMPTADGSSRSPLLAAGCSDGTIVLFSTDGDELRFDKTLGKPPSKNPRVLSLAWKSPSVLVAGYDDSMIRVYDVRNRATLRTMSLGKSASGKTDVYVWAVRCLPDGSIVSGDSTGQLKIWDATNFSLVQTIEAHKADILDVITSADGQMIVSGGADRRTVTYRMVGPRKGEKAQRWSEVMHRRFHQHDVKALASFESRDLSILASGGPDAVPIVAPFRDWKTQYHRSLPHLPQKPQIRSAATSRLLLSWWDQEISLWHISKPDRRNPGATALFVEEEKHGLAARMILKGEESISSADISQDGRFLVIATVSNVKIFEIRKRKHESRVKLRFRHVDLPGPIALRGAKIARFSPDRRWLCLVRLNNNLILAKISPTQPGEAPTRMIAQHVRLMRASSPRSPTHHDPTFETYLDSITHLTFSSDSRVLATADNRGRIDIWLLEGHEHLPPAAPSSRNADDSQSSDDSSEDSSDGDSSDSTGDDDEDRTIVQGQKWIRNPSGPSLPHLDSPILALTFRPVDTSRFSQLTSATPGLHATRQNPHPHSQDLPTGDVMLVAVTGQNAVFEFDVLEGKLSAWSRRNPASFLPENFRIVKDRVMGYFWEAKAEMPRLWLYGSSFLFMLDMSQDLPNPQFAGRLGAYEVLTPLSNMQRKRKRAKYEALPNSGAGDVIRPSEAYVGIGQHHLQSHGGGDEEDGRLIGAPDLGRQTSADEDDSTQAMESLALMRRQGGEGNVTEESRGHSNSGLSAEVPHEIPDESLDVATSGTTGSMRWWLTLNYRPILGIVPLSPAGVSEHAKMDALEEADAGGAEIIIVERPLWELDFPPRFDGGQDWDT